MNTTLSDIISQVNSYLTKNGYLPSTICITQSQYDSIHSMQPSTLGYIVDSNTVEKIMNIPIAISDRFLLLG